MTDTCGYPTGEDGSPCEHPTTAVAAIQNDREYVGFEVDAENCRDVIERRIGEAKRQVNAGVNG